MNIVVVLGLIFVLLVVALLVFRKLKGAIFSILGALLLLVGFSIYVLVNPTSPVSMWVTSNIAHSTVLDSDGEYSAGEVIWTKTFSRGELTNKVETTESAVNTMKKDKLDHLVSFIEVRIKNVIAEHLDKEDAFLKTYSVEFKDAILSVNVDLDEITIMVVKTQGRLAPLNFEKNSTSVDLYIFILKGDS